MEHEHETDSARLEGIRIIVSGISQTKIEFAEREFRKRGFDVVATFLHSKQGNTKSNQAADGDDNRIPTVTAGRKTSLDETTPNDKIPGGSGASIKAGDITSNGNNMGSKDSDGGNANGSKESKEGTNDLKTMFALQLLPSLLTKISIQFDLSYHRQHMSNTIITDKLIYGEEAIRILKRFVRLRSHELGVKNLDAITMWLAHDPSHNFRINPDQNVPTNNSSSNHQVVADTVLLNRIADYCGPTIGVYFGFLDFYKNSLRIPAILGTLIFCHQLYMGSMDSPFMPLFSIVVVFWGTYLLLFWKRRNAELNFLWSAEYRWDLENTTAHKEKMVS